MNLKTRILLGYGYLVSLLVIGAAAAALGFFELGDSIGRVLAENYESVRAATGMLEALERQDSAVLASLLGEDGAGDRLASSEESFTEALARARSNVTLAGEAASVDAIADSFAAYREARDRLVAEPPEQPLSAYRTETFPRFEEVKRRVFELLSANHRAMVVADREAQRQAARQALGYALLVTLALVSLGFLSREMQRRLLDRLTELAGVARAIAGGDRRRRAPEAREDELGVVARQLNAALDAQQEIEGQMRGRLAQQRQLVLGLLAARDAPAAVLTLAGDLVASTLELAATRAAVHAAAGAAPPTTGPAVAATAPQPVDVELAGRRHRVALAPLTGEGGRRLGWLATVE